MTTDNIFFAAAKQKLRFSSNKGELTTEQLFDLPLTSKSGFDLDTVAKTINAALKEAGEESFVGPSSNPARAGLAMRLEVVKAVIADRQAENAAKANAAARKAELERLTGILAEKQDEALKGLSLEQLQARIAELSK